MTENPFRSPAINEGIIGINSGSREDLRSVAKYQRGIMLCILGYFVAVICQFALPPSLRLVLAVGVLILGIAGTVFVFMLAMKVYSTAQGVLLGILTLVPCVGLVVLLMVNGKATKVLRQNGVKVGILGADPSTV